MRSGFFEQVLLDVVEEGRDGLFDSLDGHRHLFPCVPAHKDDLAVFDITRSSFQAKRDPFHFILVELPTRFLVARIDPHPRNGGQAPLHIIGEIEDSLFVLCNRHDHHLSRRDLRWQDKPPVVTVHHDHGADDSCREAP